MKHWLWGAVVGLGLVSANAEAHPHIWIDSYYKVDVTSPQLRSFEADWLFDLFSSNDILIEFDQDADGLLQKQEKLDAAQALTNLAKHDYFVRLKVDGEVIQPASIDIVDVAAIDGQLSVRFGITLAQPVNLQQSTLNLAFGDEENYFAMVIPDAGMLKLTGRLAETCTPIEQKAQEFFIEGSVDLHCDP